MYDNYSRINIIRAIFLFAFLIAHPGAVGRTVWGQGTPPRTGEERILPIRGEELLRRTTQPLSRPLSGALSPDGKRNLLWREVNGRWMPEYVATSSGKRIGLSMEGIPSLFPFQLSRMQWSHDSSRTALLLSHSGEYSLAVWDLAKNEAPKRISIKYINDAVKKGSALRQWIWLSERNEILVGIQHGMTTAASVPQTSKAFTWFSSQQDATDSAALYDHLHQHSKTPPLELAFIDLTTGTIRTTSGSDEVMDMVRLGEEARVGRPVWSLSSDRRTVLIPGWDARTMPMLSSDPIDANLQMRHMNVGSAKGRALQVAAGARASVYEVNISSGSVRRLYGDRQEFIQIAERVPGTNMLLTIEEDPSLHVRFASSNLWGSLNLIDLTSGRGRVLMRNIPRDSKIFPAKNGERAFLWRTQSFLPESTLYEIDLNTGKSTILNPPGLNVTAGSSDGETIVARLENPSSPAEISVWTTKTQQWHRIATTPIIPENEEAISRTSFINWKSKDNIEMSGVLVKPQGFQDGRSYPLVVFVNGGQPGDTNVTWNNFYGLNVGSGGLNAHVLAAEGYMVLLANHRFSRIMSPEAEKAGLGKFGDHVEKDIGAGIDALVAKGLVNPKQLAIYGYSYGGVEVAYALANSSRYKLGIANDSLPILMDVSAYLNHNPSWDQHAFNNFKLRPQMVDELFGRDPAQSGWSDPLRIRTPMLLRVMTWPQDDLTDGWWNALVPMTRVTHDRLIYALNKNRVPYDLIVDRDGHSVAVRKYQLEFQSRVLQWLDYFVLGKGENPLPAMRSPLDYSDEIKKARGTKTVDGAGNQ